MEASLFPSTFWLQNEENLPLRLRSRGNILTSEPTVLVDTLIIVPCYQSDKMAYSYRQEYLLSDAYTLTICISSHLIRITDGH
jgi:hypothetical protein